MRVIICCLETYLRLHFQVLSTPQSSLSQIFSSCSQTLLEVRILLRSQVALEVPEDTFWLWHSHWIDRELFLRILLSH